MAIKVLAVDDEPDIRRLVKIKLKKAGFEVLTASDGEEGVKKAQSLKPEPYILAIESSGRVGSVALGQGPNLMDELFFSGKMRHSSELFPSLDNILKKNGCSLKAVKTLCFSIGPGSFTGLRIAVTTAKMMNFALNTPLIAINTLDVITENATEYIEKTGKKLHTITPILDAKQNQFYTAIYKQKNDKWEKELHDNLIHSGDLIKIIKDSSNPITLLGEGLTFYSALFQTHGIHILPKEFWSAKARHVLKIGYNLARQGRFSDPISLIPRYIRQPDAIEKWDKKNLP